MANWMLVPLRRYADFRGRSRRTEYWMFWLFNIMLSFGFSFLERALGSLTLPGSAAATSAGAFASTDVVTVVQGLVTLALIVPGLAVGVRRLHDIGRTGWWMLAPIVLYTVIGVSMVVGLASVFGPDGFTSGNFRTPDAATAAGHLVAPFIIAGIALLLVGIISIVLLVFACTEGTHGPNRFGPDPKGDGQTLDEVFR